MKRMLLQAGLGILALSASGGTVSVAGIDLPAERGELHLHGAGLLRKGLVFKIYVGALYLSEARDAARILDKVPKRLDIHYFHTTPRKHMIRVAEETLKQNLSPEAYAARSPMIAQLHAAYRDGRKGSCASLIYRPGAGLTYAVDDKEILTIADDAFANDYFRVWLGDPPSSRTMKEALLSKLEGGE